ncbi:MAG: DUF2283 domain-containing protein [bacterium]|nr:DUF2283 domain-containing protein [bacterium]
MKNNKETKISYEPEADVLTYEITNQSIDYAQEVGNIVVHFTKENKPVLVEILEATKFLNKAEKLTGKTGKLSVAGT